MRHGAPQIIAHMGGEMPLHIVLLQNIAQGCQRVCLVLRPVVGDKELGNIPEHMAGAIDDGLAAVIAAAAVQIHNQSFFHAYHPFPAPDFVRLLPAARSYLRMTQRRRRSSVLSG